MHPVLGLEQTARDLKHCFDSFALVQRRPCNEPITQISISSCHHNARLPRHGVLPQIEYGNHVLCGLTHERPGERELAMSSIPDVTPQKFDGNGCSILSSPCMDFPEASRATE